MKTRTKMVWLELISGIFGWIWIIAAVATIYFLGAAIFSSSPWSRFWWAAGVSVVSKWLARGFIDNQKRVAFEAELVAKGYSPEDAGKEWTTRYSAGKLD